MHCIHMLQLNFRLALLAIEAQSLYRLYSVYRLYIYMHHDPRGARLRTYIYCNLKLPNQQGCTRLQNMLIVITGIAQAL